MSDLRFGVFGAGFWAPFQMAGWNEVGGAKCVAIYNRSISKAETLAKAFDIPSVYRSPEEMLDREQLDFLDIITDASSHGRFVRMAAERGIRVICQKPMNRPIRPRRPYETRSFSSTCAGRPLPRRPATYLTSGAYVRMSRSRTPWSLLLAYSRQSACVSSAAIGREYGLVRFSPQVPQREGEQPERDGAGRHDEHH